MSEPTLRAGGAELVITPPMGVEMAGYGPYEKRICTEVLDDLYARALWLESDGQALAIIAADVCMVDLATHEATVAILKERCGLDGTHLMICASHTHSGPAVLPTIAWGRVDQEYAARLPRLYAQVALAAREAAGPARIGFCRTPITRVGVNREQPAIGLTDPAAQLLRVDRPDGQAAAVLYNFGAHGVTRYPYTSRISADWPGLLAALLRSRLPGAIPLFQQGPCGNINSHEMTFDRRDPRSAQKVCDMRAGDVASRLADQILPALSAIEPADNAPIRCLWKMIELPCVPTDRAEMEKLIRDNQPAADGMTLADLRPLHQRIADETTQEIEWRQARWNVDRARKQLELLDHPPYVRKAPVQVVKIGPAVLVGWPAEVFLELGLELRQRSPLPLTFVASFANDTAGYIPTPAVYESRGKANDFGYYPREVTPSIYGHLPYRPDVGRILLEETLAMINSL